MAGRIAAVSLCVFCYCLLYLSVQGKYLCSAQGAVCNVHVDKVSASNSGHLKTPDTWYISAMDEYFGLKLLVLKNLPLGYIQAKNEVKALRCKSNICIKNAFFNFEKA